MFFFKDNHIYFICYMDLKYNNILKVFVKYVTRRQTLRF